MMHRRKFLQYAGTLSIVTLAGCTELRKTLDRPQGISTENISLGSQGIRMLSLDLTEYSGQFNYEINGSVGSAHIEISAAKSRNGNEEEFIDSFSVDGGSTTSGSFNTSGEWIYFQFFAGQSGFIGLLDAKLY